MKSEERLHRCCFVHIYTLITTASDVPIHTRQIRCPRKKNEKYIWTCFNASAVMQTWYHVNGQKTCCVCITAGKLHTVICQKLVFHLLSLQFWHRYIELLVHTCIVCIWLAVPLTAMFVASHLSSHFASLVHSWPSTVKVLCNLILVLFASITTRGRSVDSLIIGWSRRCCVWFMTVSGRRCCDCVSFIIVDIVANEEQWLLCGGNIGKFCMIYSTFH